MLALIVPLMGATVLLAQVGGVPQESLDLIKTIPLEVAPVHLEINDDRSLLLAYDQEGSWVGLSLDSLGIQARGTREETSPSIDFPVRTADGVLELSLENGDRTVRVFDRLNDRDLAEISFDDRAAGLALTKDDVSCLVPFPKSGRLLFLNTASFEVVDELSEGLEPGIDQIVLLDRWDRFLVVNPQSLQLSLVDQGSRRVLHTIELDSPPSCIVVHPQSERVFIAHSTTRSLSVLSLPKLAGQKDNGQPNEVIVLGMIHRSHRTSSLFGLDTLEALVREIAPDVVCAEIPPNRFERAWKTFEASGEIDEPRVRIFPEYTDVIFPLALEKGFRILPTAGWTAPMNDYRRAALARLEADPERAKDWKAYQEAMSEMSQVISDLGEENDPRVLHTDDYDEAIELGFGVYNRLFNQELGPGGWDHINRAHYAPIARFLDQHEGQGLRVLVTYGSAHKGWILGRLRKRTDITLLNPIPFLDQIEGDG